MRFLSGTLFLALLLQVPALPAGAGAKPQVGICFLLNEPHYVTMLETEDRRELEQLVAETLAKKLTERVAFLDARATQKKDCERDGDDPLLLTVELNQDTENSEGSIHDVVFHLRLLGDETDPDRKIQWMFRKKGTDFDVEYAVTPFHSLIAEALDKADYDHLVHKLLSQLPVSTRAELFKSTGPLGTVSWELVEHSHEDLCMSAKSELAVLTRFGADPDSDEEIVHTKVTKRSGEQWRSRKIRGKVTSDGNETEIREALKVLTKDDVEALGVYVVKFVLLRPCGSASPQESGL